MAAFLSVLAHRTIRKGLAAYAKERDAAADGPTTSISEAEEGGGEKGRLLYVESRGGLVAEGRHDHGASHTPPPSPPPSPPPPPPPLPLPPAAPPPPASPPGTTLAPLARLLGGGSSDEEDEQPVRARAGTTGGSWYAVEVGLLIVVWMGLLALLLARGRKGAPSIFGVRPCGRGYWLISLCGLVWLLAISIIAGRRLVRTSVATRRRHAARDPSAPAPLPGDVEWDGLKAAHSLVLALVAGLVAGLVGVGGGMVLGPMMLELGVLPQVSAATTGTMVLLTSSSAAAVFLLAGIVPIDYALALGFVALTGGCFGKLCIGALVRRYKAAALIILLLGGLIGVSMLATTAAGLLDLHAKWLAGRLSTVIELHMPCAA